MQVAFGTSGLRGLVSDLTPQVIADYTRAFLAACPVQALFLGRDLRPSSPDIARWIADAARAQGVAVTDCGPLPTPALAAMGAAIMVTGSHIPADRNGLKFYTPQGEITKAQELAILANLGRPSLGLTAPLSHVDATAAYVARYVTGFGPHALMGRRIGVYQHSSVGRDVMVDIVTALGGTAIPLGRSDIFIPIDTEALPPDLRQKLGEWCAEHRLDAVISADGDADRPLLTDATGAVIKGDILGAITARYLGAEVVCTPISSNSMIAGMFDRVHLTRIGSPYVIAAMQGGKVVGFEANGGFILGFDGKFPALMTRDAMLPILAGLVAGPLTEAQRFTDADRLTDVDMGKAAAFLADLHADPAGFFGPIRAVDETDGLRVTLADGRIVHLRPSGNAPEFRCYTEADSATDAAALLAEMLARLTARLG